MRSGTAGRDELSGSTITITSLGPLGGIVTTPVINHPEVGIVGVNRIVERPAFRNGAVVARKLMNELGDPDEKYNVGDVVQFPTPDGQGSYAGAVMQVREDGAVLFDFNHPLAGQPVTFEVQLIGIL